MATTTETRFLIADRIWVATALLHKEFCLRTDFKKDEIRRKMDEEGLSEGIQRGSINAHLKDHCVANVAASSGKLRILYQTTTGGLRLFRDGDFTYATRREGRKLSKSVPRREELPQKYWPLLDWYGTWCANQPANAAPNNWEDDPLIRLIGSGKRIWADEHADEYVERLRREDPFPENDAPENGE